MGRGGGLGGLGLWVRGVGWVCGDALRASPSAFIHGGVRNEHASCSERVRAATQHESWEGFGVVDWLWCWFWLAAKRRGRW